MSQWERFSLYRYELAGSALGIGVAVLIAWLWHPFPATPVSLVLYGGLGWICSIGGLMAGAVVWDKTHPIGGR